MNPLFFLAPMVLLRGRTKKGRKKATEATASPRPTPRRRGGVAGAVPPRKRNGKLRTVWTAFPWQPERVTEVAYQLIEKGVSDPENLTTAVAKTVYPVHPVSGGEFEWPPATKNDVDDVGARMIWDRIRLQVNTLVAASEERMADEATEHADEAQAAPDPEPEPEPAAEPEPEPDTDSEPEPKEPEAPSPRIGRASPVPVPFPAAAEPVARRSRLTLNRRRTMRRRPDPVSYHPEDNAVRGAVFHTVVAGETVTAVAEAVLVSCGIAEPDPSQIARYVSLIVSSPHNSSLQTVWDDEHDLPGAPPFPWGAELPTIWLPRLNDTQAAAGIITTLGADWEDGSSGLNPPPGVKGGEI